VVKVTTPFVGDGGPGGGPTLLSIGAADDGSLPLTNGSFPVDAVVERNRPVVNADSLDITGVRPWILFGDSLSSGLVTPLSGQATVYAFYELPAIGAAAPGAAGGGGEPVKADLEIFYGADRDLAFPITRGGVAIPVTTMGKAMQITNVLADLVVAKNGSNHPTETQTAVFPVVPGDFGSGAGKLGVGQYNYAVVLTDSGRSFVATYGTLTVKRPAA
jgi:hypothetical protein